MQFDRTLLISALDSPSTMSLPISYRSDATGNIARYLLTLCLMGDLIGERAAKHDIGPLGRVP